MQVLNPKEAINYPTEEAISMDEYFYKTVVDNITNNLLGIKLDEEYVNSLDTMSYDEQMDFKLRLDSLIDVLLNHVEEFLK